MVPMKWLHFVAGTLFLSITLPRFARTQDFTEARARIAAAAPNINYQEFCEVVSSGEDKIACRIRSVPSVGFLVCKKISYEGVPCAQIIETELNNIMEVGAHVRTVTVNAPPIQGVKCGQSSSLNCSGFLEGWVVNGYFRQIRDAIVEGKVEELINEVKNYTERGGWATTAGDLIVIKFYMDTGDGLYRQICDLQGFFLKAGGFLVADVPKIAKDVNLNYRCYDDHEEDEPTTEQVIAALNALIKALKTSSNKYASSKKRL